MRTIVFGDPHIKEKAIPELELIFHEIVKQEGDVLVMIGDYYDNKRPTAQEILFGTKWALRFKQRFKKVIFLRGNHDKTKDISAIDYLSYFKICVTDDYVDKDRIYFGHFMTNKSLYDYGTYQKTIKQLRLYNKVILGHQHNPQELLEEKMYHLGSIRYCQFNEVTDPYKRIVVIDKGKLEFIKLKSPYPMIDVKNIKELAKIESGNKKVRLIISSFEQFKEEVNEIQKYKNLYTEFKTKLDFSNTVSQKQPFPKTVKRKRLQQILREGIAKIEDTDVKNLLQEQLEEIK